MCAKSFSAVEVHMAGEAQQANFRLIELEYSYDLWNCHEFLHSAITFNGLEYDTQMRTVFLTLQKSPMWSTNETPVNA